MKMTDETNRREPRTPMRRAYVEYARSGTRLSRLFRLEVRRGPVVDLSKTGVQFRTTEMLESGETIFVTLRLPQSSEAIRAKAVVRRSREERKVGVENYTHVIGAEFVECTPRNWELIAAALQEQSD